MRAEESEPRLKDEGAFEVGSHAFLSFGLTFSSVSMTSGTTTLSFVVVVTAAVVVTMVVVVVVVVVVGATVVVSTSFSLPALQRAVASPSNCYCLVDVQ